MQVAATEAYRVLSQYYDDTPNALLDLEMRILSQRMGSVAGLRVLDAGCGTGRWMAWAGHRGARVFGIDACQEMMHEAARKPALAGRLACADAGSIPLCDNSADLAICSFAIGYLPEALPAIRELARIARRVIVSDLHPEAIRRGWTRSFRAAGELYEVDHYPHTAEELDAAASVSGLSKIWRMEPSFGEPERAIFQRAGKERAFSEVQNIPAVLITEWSS
jgi:ubiquinone/menaquinone biosynthesis C-methylase UbiE